MARTVDPEMRQFLSPDTKIAGLADRRVVDFWAWAYSDLVSNTIRPLFAEYIVGECLGTARDPRVEWNHVDFVYRGSLIEVKSAGYVQTWEQQRVSTIAFDIAMKKRPWDAASNTNLPAGRPADLYVMCLHADRDKADCVVHDVERWTFFVLSAKRVTEAFGNQKSIRLSRIQAICSPVRFDALRSAIDHAIDQLNAQR